MPIYDPRWLKSPWDLEEGGGIEPIATPSLAQEAAREWLEGKKQAPAAPTTAPFNADAAALQWFKPFDMAGEGVKQQAPVVPQDVEQIPLETNYQPEPTKAPDSYIRYQFPGQTEWHDAKTERPLGTANEGFGTSWNSGGGSVSQPNKDYDQYRRNLYGDAEVAAEDLAIAKAKAYTQAYEGGNIPELTGKTRVSSRLLDEAGNVIGFLDTNGNPHRYDSPAGRATPRSFEERSAGASRNLSQDKLARLGELAKANQDYIGPYVAKYVDLQRSGLAGPVVGSPSPDITEMYTLAQDLQNARVYEQSGKQINEAEFKRLQQTMPRLDQDPTTFWANYNNFMNELKSKGYSMGTGGGPTGQAPLQAPAQSYAPSQVGQPNQPTSSSGFRVVRRLK